jgi:hypothetical protein
MNKLAEIGATLIGGAYHNVEAIHGGDADRAFRRTQGDCQERTRAENRGGDASCYRRQRSARPRRIGRER